MPVPFACPHCGRQTLVPEQYVGQSGPCAGCGQMITVALPGSPFGPGSQGPTYPSPGNRPIEEDALVRMLIPVGRSGWAIAAGYFGLFAVLFVPAPIALILGIVAIRDIKKHPNRHGMGRAIFGLIMGILFTTALVLALCVGAINGFR
jgi:hypothetical protein